MTQASKQHSQVASSVDLGNNTESMKGGKALISAMCRNFEVVRGSYKTITSDPPEVSLWLMGGANSLSNLNIKMAPQGPDSNYLWTISLVPSGGGDHAVFGEAVWGKDSTIKKERLKSPGEKTSYYYFSLLSHPNFVPYVYPALSVPLQDVQVFLEGRIICSGSMFSCGVAGIVTVYLEFFQGRKLLHTSVYTCGPYQKC